MQDSNSSNNLSKKNDSTEPSSQPKAKQEQSDPQLTELAGFTDSNEDLEPTLTDGTKAPDKAPPENVNG
ncbi:MAG: hypothetical protein JWR72_2929 [Flavisolibacter sp.]|jgi:hypothetical protein|nr:hypothetical protein [Flavisolibacter sp.]